jgi:hypothetical protein
MAITDVDIATVKIATKKVAATEGTIGNAEVAPGMFLVLVLLVLSIVAVVLVEVAITVPTLTMTAFLVLPEVLLPCRIKVRLTLNFLQSFILVTTVVLVPTIIIIIIIVIILVLVFLRHRGKRHDVRFVGARRWQANAPLNDGLLAVLLEILVVICGLENLLGLRLGLDLNFNPDRPVSKLAHDFIDDLVVAFETQLFA